MRRIVFGAAVIVVCTWLQGCNESSPTRPTRVIRVTPPPVLPLPPGPAPKLEISDFSVSGYDITLRVTETGGEGGAYLGGIWTEDERRNTDGGCGSASPNLRVEPGATWDIRSLGYCAPSGLLSTQKL
jgi:hypothetical protein